MTYHIQNIFLSFLGANIVLTILSAGFLQLLWGLINALQIIVLSYLFKLDIPDNAGQLMQMILKLCSMQFVQTDDILNDTFGFRETEAFSKIKFESGEEISRYEDAGYESTIFLLLLGPICFIAVFFFVAIVFKFILFKATLKCGDNCLTRIIRVDSPYLVIMTRFMLESCIEIGLSAMITLLSIDKETFSSAGEAFSTACAALGLLLLFLAPIYLYKVAARFMEYIIMDMEVKQTELSPYSRLFEDYRPKLPAIRYPVVFFLRRYSILLAMTLLPFHKLLQIQCQMIGTIFVIAYLLYYQPYLEKKFNRQEAINEITVLLAAYPLLVFTEWVFDVDSRNKAGWSIVFLILINILFNLTIVIVSFIVSSIKKTKYALIRLKKRREMTKRLKEKTQKLEEHRQD